MKRYWIFEFNYLERERERERETIVKGRHFLFFPMT